MAIEAALCGAVAGAVGRRVAGGLVGDLTGRRLSHLVATVLFGVLIGVSAFIGGAPWQFCLTLGFGVWLGHILGLHDGAGMGWVGLTWTAGRYAKDFLAMLVYGIQCVVLGSLFVWFCPLARGLAAWPLPVAAFSVPVLYTVAWLIQDHRPGKRGFNGNPLELAEWLIGASFGIFASLVGAAAIF